MSVEQDETPATTDAEIVLEFRVEVDGQMIRSRRMVPRDIWDRLWRSPRYLENFAVARAAAVKHELQVRNADS